MYAKVSTIQVKPGKMDECVSSVASMILLSRKTKGNKAGIMLIDRNQNKAITIVIWEAKADMIASENETEGSYQEASTKLAALLDGSLVWEQYEVGFITFR